MFCYKNCVFCRKIRKESKRTKYEREPKTIYYDWIRTHIYPKNEKEREREMHCDSDRESIRTPESGEEKKTQIVANIHITYDACAMSWTTCAILFSVYKTNLVWHFYCCCLLLFFLLLFILLAHVFNTPTIRMSCVLHTHAHTFGYRRTQTHCVHSLSSSHKYTSFCFHNFASMKSNL